MPRKARVKSESQLYHVILKGYNSQLLFQDDEDKLEFLKKLEFYHGILNFEIHCYCLMDNHVHMIIKDLDDYLDKIMKSLCISYVQYFNRKYDRSGPIFNDRYKSEPIETELYYLTAQRYIHQNPLKAGIDKTEDYPWSSYSVFLEDCMSMVYTSMLLDLLGGKNRFIEYMEDEDEEECLDVKEERMNDNIARKCILNIAEVESLEVLQKIDKSKMKEIIKTCRKSGMSIRQISRLTGVGKRIIELQK